MTFQEYRQHLIARCGFQPNSNGTKIHKAYREHCAYMRSIGKGM